MSIKNTKYLCTKILTLRATFFKPKPPIVENIEISKSSFRDFITPNDRIKSFKIYS